MALESAAAATASNQDEFLGKALDQAQEANEDERGEEKHGEGQAPAFDKAENQA